MMACAGSTGVDCGWRFCREPEGQNQHTLTISFVSLCRCSRCGWLLLVGFLMEEARTFCVMVLGRMVLGEVVSVVVICFVPLHDEMALFNLIINPAEMHVHSFRVTLFDGVIGNARGSVVVRYDECLRLWMMHFEKGSLHDFCFLAIVEEAGKFGFSGACHDVAKHAADNEDWSLDWWHWIFFAEWHMLRKVA